MTRHERHAQWGGTERPAVAEWRFHAFLLGLAATFVLVVHVVGGLR